MQESERNTLDKFTQFTMPYPNRIEPDLELAQFPLFSDIERTNPTKDQLLLRGEEARRLNIIFDNNNTSYEDKNIKEILSNDLKNTGRMDDIYDIDLPDCFMRSAVVKVNTGSNKIKNMNNIKTENENLEKFENDENAEKFNEIKNNIKEEVENKNEEENYDDFDIDIDYEKNENDYENADEDKKDDIRRYNDIYADINNNDDEKDNESYMIENKIKDFKKEKDYAIIDIEEAGSEVHMAKDEQKIKSDHDTSWNDREIIDMDDPYFNGIYSPNEEEEKIKKKEIKNLHNKYTITTINIIGEKNGENYIGQIIEKGHNYPSNLGIIKTMELDEFSENYFGEKLNFGEISNRVYDFEKVIRLIPIGTKKYLFNSESSPKSEIYKEENNIIILHGKVGQDTFYYIMKLTGQINNNSEYTIFKVKDDKNTIRHFLNSVGLNDGGDLGKDFSDNVFVSKLINYGIEESPNREYAIFPGQIFLSKYRKLLKKEKEKEEKNKLFEEKKKFIGNYEKYAKERDIDLENKKKEKIKEKEEKENNIKMLKNISIKLNRDEKIYIKAYNEVEQDSMNMDDKEEIIRSKLGHANKKYNQNKKSIKKLEDSYENNMKNYSKEFNSMMKNEEEFNQKDTLLEKKKKKINEMNSKILCIKCNSNERDVIFCECSHLTICRSCLEELAEEKGKSKAICPACNIMSRRFFYIKTV